MFDLDASAARKAMWRSLARIVDTETGMVRRRDSSVEGAFSAVGGYLRAAIAEFKDKHPETGIGDR